ncbi:phosphatase PAP2 family protein [Alicyclobacillaceae bacterium I2511]|nr:phosphatase PAP2 family protein [Alicyclobacillaceae bacterium I2511]
MDLTLMMDQYGYWVLFFALLFELIAFGLPTEVLMGYAGVLVYQGKLGWFPAVLAAGVGSMVGISIAYWIGARLGAPFFHRYGAKVHLGPDRLEKVSHWFSLYGDKLIIVAYFIPGARHVTGYFSGITRIPFYKFATYAYLGAALWVFTFVTLGKLLGPQWVHYHQLISKYLVMGGIFIGILLMGVYLYHRYKGALVAGAKQIMRHSPTEAKLLIIGSGGGFFILVGVMVGVIEDHLTHEFTVFNSVNTLVLHSALSNNLTPLMQGLANVASPVVLLPLAMISLLWILLRDQDKTLEVISLGVVVAGGVVLEEALQYLFFRITPPPLLHNGTLPSAFPGEHSLMSLTIWAFTGYVIARRSSNTGVKILLALLVALIAVGLGLSRVYLGVQTPSDILAGYVFAGVWLTMCVAVLEILRELRGFGQSTRHLR